MAQEVLRGWLLRATFRGTPRTQALDSRAGLLVPATPTSERPGVSRAQQQEQSKDVFCPVPAKNARRPTNSSDCRFLGGNPLWGRGLLELSPSRTKGRGGWKRPRPGPIQFVPRRQGQRPTLTAGLRGIRRVVSAGFVGTEETHVGMCAYA